MDKFPLVSCMMLAGRTQLSDIIAAIECFKAQTYKPTELIIINNAKSQFEASALNLKAERNIVIVDTPMPYFAGMARNYGISTANGQILAQFDADYWYAPTRLEVQIANLAENEASVVVLSKTLKYSFVSGRASYYSNDRNAVLGTMMFVRPKALDYPNIDKQEELGLLERFQKSEAKIVALPLPELACKLYLTAGSRIQTATNYGLTKAHFTILKRMLKNRHSL